MKVFREEQDFTKAWINEELNLKVWLELHEISYPALQDLYAYGLFVILLPLGQGITPPQGLTAGEEPVPWFHLPKDAKAYCMNTAMDKQKLEIGFGKTSDWFDEIMGNTLERYLGLHTQIFPRTENKTYTNFINTELGRTLKEQLKGK